MNNRTMNRQGIVKAAVVEAIGDLIYTGSDDADRPAKDIEDRSTTGPRKVFPVLLSSKKITLLTDKASDR